METGRRILLLSLVDWDFYKSIEKNLSHNGFDVTVVLSAGYIFRYRNFGQRLYNFFRKNILGDRRFKQILRKNYTREQQLANIEKQEKYDYCLVLRADFFPVDILKFAKQKSEAFVSYHFDGLARNEKIFQRINLFDRFYVFDRNDVKKYPQFNLKLANNFYFDCFDFVREPDLKSRRAYFLGSYHPARITELENSRRILQKVNLTLDIELICIPEILDEVASKYDSFRFSDKAVPYEEYLTRTLSSAVILDLLIPEHQGFSFRIFEGLYYKRKVITTNEHVKRMDFYHESNFFILKDDDVDRLADFLRKPYMDIDPGIIDKYSFSNWIKTVLLIN